MRNLFFLFLFPFFLHASFLDETDSTNYDNCVCPDNFHGWETHSFVLNQTYGYSNRTFSRPSNCNLTTRSKTEVVNLMHVSSIYYSFELWIRTDSCVSCSDTEEYIESHGCVSKCDENQTRINGECIDTLPQSCESLHGADWLENSASTVESCGAFVDGQNYSNASFYDAFENYRSICCLLPIKPSFQCSELGDNWASRSESSESACSALVDGVLIDSSNYVTGDNFSSTCCVHLITDNNATEPTDNNETTPPTDNNESTPPTDNNETSPLPTDNNDSTPKTLDDAIEQLRNDNNLNASNAQSKYDDLIIGLRDVKENQTQIGEVAHQDAQEIKDAISNEEEEQESENRVSEAQEGNSEILDLGENAIASYTEGFDSLQNVISGYTAPVVSASGSCDLSATIFNRSVSFSTGFASLIPTFRPFVMFILNVVFSLLLIKYTILAWRDVIKFASQTFGR